MLKLVDEGAPIRKAALEILGAVVDDVKQTSDVNRSGKVNVKRVLWQRRCRTQVSRHTNQGARNSRKDWRRALAEGVALKVEVNIQISEAVILSLQLNFLADPIPKELNKVVPEG